MHRNGSLWSIALLWRQNHCYDYKWRTLPRNAFCHIKIVRVRLNNQRQLYWIACLNKVNSIFYTIFLGFMLLFSRLWIKVVKFAIFRSKTQKFAVFGQIRNFCEYRAGREKNYRPKNVRRILVRGSMPPCRLRQIKFWKFDYEMVHSEVYLNKYVVSIAPFSTPACPDCSQNIT